MPKPFTIQMFYEIVDELDRTNQAAAAVAATAAASSVTSAKMGDAIVA